jgi:hypothetical protein
LNGKGAVDGLGRDESFWRIRGKVREDSNIKIDIWNLRKVLFLVCGFSIIFLSELFWHMNQLVFQSNARSFPFQ